MFENLQNFSISDVFERVTTVVADQPTSSNGAKGQIDVLVNPVVSRRVEAARRGLKVL